MATWEPVNERALRPPSWSAIARSAIVTCSPVASSMSSSRGSGAGVADGGRLRDAEEADGEGRGGVEDADVARCRGDRDAEPDEGEHRPTGGPGQVQVHRDEHRPDREHRGEPDDGAPDDERQEV